MKQVERESPLAAVSAALVWPAGPVRQSDAKSLTQVMRS